MVGSVCNQVQRLAPRIGLRVHTKTCTSDAPTFDHVNSAGMTCLSRGSFQCTFSMFASPVRFPLRGTCLTRCPGAGRSRGSATCAYLLRLRTRDWVVRLLRVSRFVHRIHNHQQCAIYTRSEPYPKLPIFCVGIQGGYGRYRGRLTGGGGYPGRSGPYGPQ